MQKSFKKGAIYAVLGVIILFLLWGLLYFIAANEYLIPSPVEVIVESFKRLFSAQFYLYLSSTLLRSAVAVLISFLLAGLLAILSHLSNAFESVIMPIISVVRSLPVLAVLLIILIIVPRGIAPIIVCCLSIFPIAYSGILNYLNTIDDDKKELLKVYKVPLKVQIFSVYLKGYFPLMIKQITALFSFSLKLIVSAEILANVYKSIGGEISNASIYSNITALFSLTAIVCLIGLIVEFIGVAISNNMEKKYR